MIALTPFHHVELSEELAYLIDAPPEHDVVIRTLSRKLSNDQPLIQGDLVLAGRQTLSEFPRVRAYPVHFRKTYYPTSFHPPATLEYEKHERIAGILKVPGPLGATPNSFRSCYIPGVPLDRLSPFGIEPPSRNLELAAECEPAILFGLWNLFESLASQIEKLHENGLTHGDLFLHNVIVSNSPIDVWLIDFAQSKRRKTEPADSDWEALCQADRNELHRHALWVQCGLGAQPGALADAARQRAPALLGEDAGRCLRLIAEHSLL